MSSRRILLVIFMFSNFKFSFCDDNYYKLISHGVATIIWDNIRDGSQFNLSANCNRDLRQIAENLRFGSLTSFKCEYRQINYFSNWSKLSRNCQSSTRQASNFLDFWRDRLITSATTISVSQ